MRLLHPILGLLLAGIASGFPPAPPHEFYGIVRDEDGHPVEAGAEVRLNGPAGPVVTGVVTPREPGVNYSLTVPMDAGTKSNLYQATALTAGTSITIEVIIGGTSHVPIQAQGESLQVGAAGERTRLDLTLGVDSDGDGLPDSWEQQIVDLTAADSIQDVTPGGDSDNDGVTNFDEYVAGTYAFTDLIKFELEIIEIEGGLAHCRFLAVRGRTYEVMSTGDFVNFDRTAISFQADGSDTTEIFRAERTRFEDIYLPTGEGVRQFFQLHVH